MYAHNWNPSPSVLCSGRWRPHNCNGQCRALVPLRQRAALSLKASPTSPGTSDTSVQFRMKVRAYRAPYADHVRPTPRTPEWVAGPLVSGYCMPHCSVMGGIDGNWPSLEVMDGMAHGRSVLACKRLDGDSVDVDGEISWLLRFAMQGSDTRHSLTYSVYRHSHDTDQFHFNTN